jgi:SAM-dependent methyltransferase
VDHADHVGLLREAVEPGGTWADIGAGTGAFTLALAELLGPGGQIVAVDLDRGALAANAEAVVARFPDVGLRTLASDFTRHLALPSLDGIVMANSLHFVAPDRQAGVVATLASHLRARGAFVVVEYDADHGNPWVPHPFRYGTWAAMAAEAGLSAPRRLGHVPSRFLGGIYSAVASLR